MKAILYSATFITLFYGNAFGQPGALDPSFGGDGVVYSVLGEFLYSIDAPQAITILPDGKILVAESNLSADNGDSYGLVRYNPDGSYDTTFGSGGSVLTEIANGQLADMVVQADGKIIVTGNKNSDSHVFQLIRYLPDGTLDPTFGSGGIVLANIGTNASPASMAIQSDGRIVVAGESYNGANDDVTVARYKQDGTLDPTFGNGGIVTTDIVNDDDRAHSVAIQPDGKIVVAAMFNDGVTNNFALLRYKKNGIADASFGIDGIVMDDSIFVNSMLLQPDGKIVVAGTSYNDFCLIRYSAEGNHDNTFGTNGRVITDMGGNDIANSVVMQPDGKLIAVGTNSSGVANTTLVRYLPNGGLDLQYGAGGKVSTDLIGENYGLCAALQPNGKLVVGSLVQEDYEDGDMAITRYLGDTIPDCLAPSGSFTYLSSPNTVKLEWEDIDFAIGYRIQYKIKGTGSWTATGSTAPFKIVNNLQSNTEYVWEVKSICNLNPLTTSDWSEKQHFITDLRLSDESMNTELFVFPNPFSDNATVQFFAGKNEYLEIDVLDLQGRKIKTIAEGNYEAGDQELILNKENLQTGIYLLKLTSRSGISIQKIMIE